MKIVYLKWRTFVNKISKFYLKYGKFLFFFKWLENLRKKNFKFKEKFFNQFSIQGQINLLEVDRIIKIISIISVFDTIRFIFIEQSIKCFENIH